MTELTKEDLAKAFKEALRDFHGADTDIVAEERVFLRELMLESKRKKDRVEKLKQTALGYMLIAFLGGVGTILTWIGIKFYDLWHHLHTLPGGLK